MTKILGIDTGTNSLGWAIVEKKAEQYCLLDKGVNIFQEGVNIDKDNESSKAAERTGCYPSTLLSHKATQNQASAHLDPAPPLSPTHLLGAAPMATKEHIPNR